MAVNLSSQNVVNYQFKLPVSCKFGIPQPLILKVAVNHYQKSRHGQKKFSKKYILSKVTVMLYTILSGIQQGFVIRCRCNNILYVRGVDEGDEGGDKEMGD